MRRSTPAVSEQIPFDIGRGSNAVGHIYARAAAHRLTVELAARANVVRNIGNMHTEHVAVALAADAYRIVKVLCVRAVKRKDGLSAQVEPAVDVAAVHPVCAVMYALLGDALRLGKQLAVKCAVRSERYSVLVEYRRIDRIGRSALAENALDNAARRSRMIGIVGNYRADAAARVRYGVVARIYQNNKII